MASILRPDVLGVSKGKGYYIDRSCTMYNGSLSFRVFFTLSGGLVGGVVVVGGGVVGSSY